MPRIELRGILKRFGRTVAIDDIHAVIEDKEFFVVVGASACGKTTLLWLIVGLIRPDKGESPLRRGGGERPYPAGTSGTYGLPRFEQVGAPKEVLKHPATSFVAGIVESYCESVRRAFF